MRFALALPCLVLLQDPAVDWPAEGKAALSLLREMIRIDTTNPPPDGSGKKNADETALCRLVKEKLASENISCEIVESEAGRGSLIARYRGDGSKKPILIMAHIDVVSVDRSKWIADPFEAVEKDGYLYGRGAIDDKGMAAVGLQVLRILHRTRPKLSRDVIVMLNADEEAGSEFGARFIVEKHWDKIDPEFILNEGGRVLMKDGKILRFEVQSAEKIYNDVRLWLRGDSGHSSVPLPDNALFSLGDVLARLRAYQAPLRLTETVRVYFGAIADLPGNEKFRDLLKAASGGDLEAAAQLAQAKPAYNAVLRSTFVPTVVKGGIRVNVLPPDVEINFNIRLLPGDDLDGFLKTLAEKAGISDYAVVSGKEFEDWKKGQGKVSRAAFVIDTRDAEAPASPLGTELFSAIERVSRALRPDAPVVPMMSTGATDSRWFRAKGRVCYGLVPMPVTEEDRATVHGHNERVWMDGFPFAVEYLYRIVTETSR